MSLEAKKIQFVQEFLRLQNEEIVTGLEMMMHKWKVESMEVGFKPMTIGQLNAEIDEALEDSHNERIIKTSDLKEKYNKWS